MILRMSPLSVGTVKISPQASNKARAPVGERAEILNAFGFNLGEVRPHRLKVAGNMDFDVCRLMSIQVEKLDGAELLDHDRVRTRRRGLEIEAVAVESF